MSRICRTILAIVKLSVGGQAKGGKSVWGLCGSKDAQDLRLCGRPCTCRALRWTREGDACAQVARQLYGKSFGSMVLELNASDDRGIGVVRQQVQDFASSRTLFGCALPPPPPSPAAIHFSSPWFVCTDLRFGHGVPFAHC